MKLGRYVIVDNGGNYVTFSQAVRSDKDFLKKLELLTTSLNRLCSSAMGSSKFVYF